MLQALALCHSQQQTLWLSFHGGNLTFVDSFDTKFCWLASQKHSITVSLETKPLICYLNDDDHSMICCYGDNRQYHMKGKSK